MRSHCTSKSSSFIHIYIITTNPHASSLGDLRSGNGNMLDYDSNPHPSPAASSVNHGTPSHLSIGTSSIYTTTSGWTEGTPSYTESSMSGSLGRYSADPGQLSHGTSHSWCDLMCLTYLKTFPEISFPNVIVYYGIF